MNTHVCQPHTDSLGRRVPYLRPLFSMAYLLLFGRNVFLWANAFLPTKRQIKRLGLKGQRLWDRGHDVPLRDDHCPEFTHQPCRHRRKDPHRPLTESFVTNIGHTTVSTHTEFLSPVAHTLKFKPLRNMFFLCLLEISLLIMDSGFQSGMCPSIPSCDGSKWRFTKSPYRREQRNNPPKLRRIIQLYI